MEQILTPLARSLRAHTAWFVLNDTQCYPLENFVWHSPEVEQPMMLPFMALAQWMCKQQEPLLVEDLREAYEILFMLASESSVPENGTLLALPLRSGQASLGMMLFYHPQIGAFHTKILPVLQRQAKQYAVLVERLLLREVQQTQSRLLTALHAMQDILNRTLDLETLLNLLLEQIERVVPFDTASLFFLEGQQAVLRCWRGFDRWAGVEGNPGEHRVVLPIEKSPTLQRMVRTAQALVVADVRDLPDWLDTPFSKHIRAWLGTPISIQGQVVAFLMLDKAEPNFYTNTSLELISALGVHIALVLRNARLFGELSENLQRERRLTEISRVISRALDLPTILKNVVRLAADLVGANAGALGLIDFENEQITFAHLHNFPAGFTPPSEARHEGVSWEIVEKGQPIRMEQYAQHPRALEIWKATGVKAFLGVPVFSGTMRLGALGLFSFSPEKRFNSRDVALAEVVGRQAGVAIQNALLFEDTQRRAEESETLRQAATAVLSTLRMDEAIDRILEQLVRVVPYDSASVQLLREGVSQIVGGRGLPELLSLTNTRFPLDDSNPATQVYATGEPYILEDAPAAYEIFSQPPHDYIRAWMGVPLIYRGQIIGMISLDSLHPGTFKPYHARLVMVFAAQMSIAIENARLFEAEHRRAEELSVLHRLSQAVVEETTLDSLLDRVIRMIGETLYANNFGVGLVDEAQGVVHLRYADWNHHDQPRLINIPIQQGIIGKVVQTATAYRINDVTQHPDYVELQPNILSELCIPLIANKRVIGVINLESSVPEAFSEADERLLDTFAGHLATAIEKLRLFDEIQQMAITDPLTGLFNRRQFFRLGYIELERSHRYAREMAMMMLDIDHFKKFNDTYGHQIGDVVLQAVARQCRESMRAIDIIGRYGGEEFSILMPETSQSGALRLAERLRQQVQDLGVPTRSGILRVTISVGVACLNLGSEEMLENLIERADKALYVSKQTGRNRVSLAE
ncbi:MAG: hypothetical protein OHK0052_20370 [Anaerolineales bacterium]